MILRAGTGRPFMAVDAALIGFLATVAAASLLIEAITDRRRRSAMQAFAQRCQFAWLGEQLPNEFPMDLTDELFPWILYGGPDKVTNALGGLVGQDYRLCFDLRVSRGRGHVDATIVAVLSPRARPEPLAHEAYLFREEGQWRMVTLEQTFFRRRGRIPPDSIEAIWEALT